MATRKRERFFAAFGAILFLATSSALVIALAVSNVESHNQNNNQPANTSKEKRLTGTKMQGFTPLAQPLKQLQIKDIETGTGAEVKPGDTITADYVGALASSGVIFDASADHGGPLTFSLSGVIAGWSQGIPGMKVGGTRELLVPSSLGYGTQGSGSAIPPNSDLVFTVTVTRID